jgi:glycosyltransferase involved in cell wall biosynthesis
MNIGVVNEDIWDFFHEVHQELSDHHRVRLFERKSSGWSVFKARMTRYRLDRDLRAFMEQNDALFFEWGSELLALATALPKTCGIVTRLHRYDIYEWHERINWGAVDSVILVSEAKRERFAERYPQHAHKVVVIPEAVSLTRFRPEPRPFQGDIGILCHLKPRKRVYDLILTFAELSRRRPGLHLHIGGDERPGYRDYHEAMHSLVRRLGLQEQVTFYGQVTDPVSWYRKIDIFISNSYSEGLQVSPMEAIASGCYCFSHHWEGADELLPAGNLFFTGTELQEKILEYCDAPAVEREAKKQTLYAMVRERFDVDRTKVQIRQLVERAGTPHLRGATSR